MRRQARRRRSTNPIAPATISTALPGSGTETLGSLSDTPPKSPESNPVPFKRKRKSLPSRNVPVSRPAEIGVLPIPDKETLPLSDEGVNAKFEPRISNDVSASNQIGNSEPTKFGLPNTPPLNVAVALPESAIPNPNVPPEMLADEVSRNSNDAKLDPALALKLDSPKKRCAQPCD